MKNLSTAAQKWVSAMSSAQTQQAYKDGVQAVTIAPNNAAAANSQGYLNGTQQSVASGNYQRANLAVGLAGWQQPTLTKGAARLASGAQAALGKMQSFFQQFGPQLQALTAKVQAMPNVTDADKDARMNAMVQGLRALKGKWRTG